MDILKTIKQQSAKQIEELKDLGGKLSGKLKDVIGLLPEDTRHKSIEDFLNGIRETVLGKAPRKYAKRATKKTGAKKRGRPKATKTKGTTRRGRKKKAATETAATE